MEEYVSYNKLIRLFEEYQVSQEGVGLNSFGHGNIVMFGMTESGMTPTYPFMFVTPKLVTYDENIVTYSFDVIFADRINDDMSNEIDVISDMDIQSRRFMSYIKRGMNQTPALFDFMDFNFTQNGVPFIERFNDYCGGVSLNMDIIVFNDINACDYYVPVSPTPSVTPTNTQTPTITPTSTITATPTNTPTNTITPTNTVTPTNTPTNTQTPTPSITASVTPSITPTQTPTITPTNTITPTSSTIPSLTPTPTPTPAINLYVLQNSKFETFPGGTANFQYKSTSGVVVNVSTGSGTGVRVVVAQAGSPVIVSGTFAEIIDLGPFTPTTCYTRNVKNLTGISRVLFYTNCSGLGTSTTITAGNTISLSFQNTWTGQGGLYVFP